MAQTAVTLASALAAYRVRTSMIVTAGAKPFASQRNQCRTRQGLTSPTFGRLWRRLPWLWSAMPNRTPGAPARLAHVAPTHPVVAAGARGQEPRAVSRRCGAAAAADLARPPAHARRDQVSPGRIWQVGRPQSIVCPRRRPRTRHFPSREAAVRVYPCWSVASCPCRSVLIGPCWSVAS